MSRRPSLATLGLVVLGGLAAGPGCSCGGGAGLDDFLPPIPDPTGEAPTVAGGVVDADHLLTGAAATGMAGDFYLENDRARFIVQSPARVIGVVPQGGNLIDAAALDADGRPVTDDHFGELSMIYLLGRTCEHESVEVVQDGSGGGVAAIVARGFATHNDFINLKGLGLIPFAQELDPDVPDEVECATTYILAPGSATLEVYWTLFNGGERTIEGPFAALSDTGGEIETWAPTRGFERLGPEAILSTGPAPIEYDVFQGPGVAYGLLPLHDVADVNSAYLISGISIILFGTDDFLTALRPEGFYVDLEPDDGVTNRMAFSIGRDAAGAEEAYRAIAQTATQGIAGAVVLDTGAPAAGARVGLFVDADGDGALGPDDPVATYLDADADGEFAGRIAPGAYLARADLLEQARSEVVAVDLTADRTLELELPAPVLYDVEVTDVESGDPVPAKLAILGDSPAEPDPRLHSTYDRVGGLTAMRFLRFGTTIDLGPGADDRLALPAGGSYRVIATRGPEWSFASADVDPEAGDLVGDLAFPLRRLLDTTGYVASEYHVHAVGSPDSPVSWADRVIGAAVDGVELWASTEHEYIAELQPIVEALGLERWTRAIAGEEVSPFVYGHFIGFPLEPDDSPARGAIDWARGAGGFALLPGEIMSTLRDLGAQIVQVNHPRATVSSPFDFLQYFDRAALSFDYETRTIDGDEAAQPVPNDFLRLEPGQSVWALGFNALEVWNSLETLDSDDDGVRELVALDVVMRDWFNFLSFGVPITPMGNSDTHTKVRDPMGIPRTMVRVPDDTAEAIADGALVEAVYDTLAARGGAPRDVVVTNGPMIRVTEMGDDASVLGAVVAATGGLVRLSVAVQTTPYAPIDTIEVFADATPEVGGDESVLQPLICYTTRAIDDLAAGDPCAGAPLGVLPLAIDTVDLGGGFERREAEVVVELSAADVAESIRAGASGEDAWVVVRARGQRGIFPIYLSGLGGVLGDLVRASAVEIDAAMTGAGLPATAFTAPVMVDFDGGGYRAPFAPQ
jgi:hypothetical protein